MSQKRLLVLVLAVAVAGFAGAAPAREKAAADAPIRVSIAHWEIDQSITGQPDPVYDLVRNAVGIQIEPVATGWGDWRDKINVWAASGELPDTWSTDIVGTTVYRNWIANRLVSPLPEDLTAYPGVYSITQAGDYQAFQVDGKNWFIPRANYPDPAWWANDRGVLIRTDWLENLGLPMPQTREQFIDTMVAFATRDPNRSGRNDTIGLTAHNAGFLWGAFMEVAPNLAWGGWVKEDGRWVHSAVSQQARALYSALRELYQRGGLDPDFAVLGGNDGIDRFGAGRAGALAIQVAAKHWHRPAEVWASLNPDVPFEQVSGIVPERRDKNGQRWRFITASYWSETYINSNVSDAKMDAILRLYDFLMSDEFQTVQLWGFEGIDYQERTDGTKVSLLAPDVFPGTKYPFLHSMGYWTTWGDQHQYDYPWISEGLRRESKEHLDWVLANAKAPDVAWELDAAAATLPSYARVNFDAAEDRTTFILSSRSEDAVWDEIISKYNAMGYQQLEREMNEYARSIGK
ncbi:MAG: extracellular solute-binding protein [Spirochaetaceae bacterium]|nr:MAG: extracellular solute-binding protein [Spirochaetaceae bacterium]